MDKIILTETDKIAAETVGICMRAVDAIEADLIRGVMIYGIPKDMPPARALKMFREIEALMVSGYPEMTDGVQCKF